MTSEEAAAFARGWVQAWNDRDVEEVLTHFADDVVFTSPVAAEVIPESHGVIRGKQSLRQYWSLALQRNPGLRFELRGVYSGVDTVVIHYRNQDGSDRCEVLTFSSGLVRVGHGTYPVAAS